MDIAIVTFDGFNELDSLIALGIINRGAPDGWNVSIASPSPMVTSMNGVTLCAQMTLADASTADAVIVGSGTKTRDVVRDPSIMRTLKLDPGRQLVAAQCSGALVLAELGLLDGVPACTDTITKPWVQEAGVEVLEQPFFANDNVATAGGCLASQYLAAWLLVRLAGENAAREALHYVAPVGEKDLYVSRALGNVIAYTAGVPPHPGRDGLGAAVPT